MGILAEGDGIYNYARNGTALPQGQAINRRYAINDYEFFGQDSWRINRRLTVSYGLRWVLEAPPYETNGYQVAPCVEAASGGCTNQNVADWFNHSAQLATAGQPANNAGEIGFVLGGPKNHGPGLWNWDHKDFSPRIAVAWAPDTGEGWVSKILGKKDQFTIRGGYSIVYDHFGVPVVNSFDQNGSFGLSTRLGNSAGSVTASNAPRFTCLIPGSSGQSCLPTPCPSLNNPGCLFGPPPAGGFPNYPKQHRLCHQLGARPVGEDALYAHVQFLAGAPDYLPLLAPSCLCGQCRSAVADASGYGHAHELERSGEQHQIFPGSYDALEAGCCSQPAIDNGRRHGRK